MVDPTKPKVNPSSLWLIVFVFHTEIPFVLPVVLLTVAGLWEAAVCRTAGPRQAADRNTAAARGTEQLV